MKVVKYLKSHGNYAAGQVSGVSESEYNQLKNDGIIEDHKAESKQLSQEERDARRRADVRGESHVERYPGEESRPVVENTQPVQAEDAKINPTPDELSNTAEAIEAPAEDEAHEVKQAVVPNNKMMQSAPKSKGSKKK